NQQDGAGSRDDEAPDEARRVQAENPEHNPAEDRSDDAEQQIDQYSVAAAPHDFAGEIAGEDTDDDLPEEVHHRGMILERLVAGCWGLGLEARDAALLGSERYSDRSASSGLI